MVRKVRIGSRIIYPQIIKTGQKDLLKKRKKKVKQNIMYYLKMN